MEKKEVLEKVKRILERCINNELKFGTSSNWKYEVCIYEDDEKNPSLYIQLADSSSEPSTINVLFKESKPGKLSLISTKNQSDATIKLTDEEFIEIKFLMNKTIKTGEQNLVDFISKFV